MKTVISNNLKVFWRWVKNYLFANGGAKVLLFSGIFSLLSSLVLKLAVELFLDNSKSDGGAIEPRLASSSLAFLSTQRWNRFEGDVSFS